MLGFLSLTDWGSGSYNRKKNDSESELHFKIV